MSNLKLPSEVGFFHVGVIDQLGGVALKSDPARFENVSIMRHFKGTVGILFNEKDRVTLAVQFEDDIKDCIDHNGSESQGGFVEKENLRVRHEAPANGKHLLLAA